MDTLIEKLNQAHTLKKEFRLREAAEYYNECAQIDPSCVIASAQAGLCHLLLGEPDLAEPFLKQAFKASFNMDILVGTYLSAVLSANDKEMEAETVREKCLKIDSEADFPESYMLTAEMLNEKQKYEETLRLVNTLSSTYADSPWMKIPRNHYRIIRALANAGIFDVAEALSSSLTEHTADSWEGLAALAAIAAAKKEYEKAYDYTLKAIAKGGDTDPMLAAQQHWLAVNK